MNHRRPIFVECWQMLQSQSFGCGGKWTTNISNRDRTATISRTALRGEPSAVTSTSAFRPGRGGLVLERNSGKICYDRTQRQVHGTDVSVGLIKHSNTACGKMCRHVTELFASPVHRFSPLRAQLRQFPELKQMLSQSSNCAVCSEPFLNTWLECVHFVKPRVSYSVYYSIIRRTFIVKIAFITY